LVAYDYPRTRNVAMKKLTKTKKIVIVVFALILLWLGFIIYSEYKQESKQPVFNSTPDFTTLINIERTKRNLPTLIDSQELQRVAERKCNDMVSRHYNAHQDPDGKFIWDYPPHGFKYGENLAGGFYPINETGRHTAAYPEQFENIIDPMFKEVGHYTCFDGKQYLNVEVFKS